MDIKSDITKTCGNTPLIYIDTESGKTDTKIYGKAEFFNPGFSIKDRIGTAMIEDAFAKGKINENSTIVEPTSGNTGIALAIAAKAKGLKLIITMPETMSVERRKLLKHLGATLVLTKGDEGMHGSIEKAKQIVKKTSNAFMPDQFSNPANPETHRKTTAIEILNDTDGKIDIFVAGVGTGGTITGVSEVLKKKNPHLISIAVEPSGSPVISGKSPGIHKIQGIGAGFIPANLNTKIIDEVVIIKDEEALLSTKQLALQEGILCGISSGAAFSAVKKLASRPENKKKTIVFIMPDATERYLGSNMF